MRGELHQIGEVAERAGLSLRTVRYYEEVGLLIPETRTEGGFRLYTDEQIERLVLVKHMKPLGFTVQQTRELLDTRDRLHDPSIPDDEHDEALKRLASYAQSAEDRCQTLREQLGRAEEFAKRLRRETQPKGTLVNR